MSSHDTAIRHGVGLSVITLLAVALAWKPLSDVDLGWHLAGGLLIHSGLPLWGEDSLGSTGHLWWNYSWLFQIIIAELFGWGGFTALCILQGLLILGSVLLFFSYVLRHYLVAIGQTPNISATPVVWAIALLPFLAPMWHLRPQLVSISLFIILLSPNLRFVGRFALTALWANVHVFWVFSPLIVGVRAIDEPRRWRRHLGEAFVLSLCGMLTPFGTQTYVGLFQYAFVHRTAYALIKEFQLFSPNMGFVFWSGLLLLGVVAWQAIKYRETIPRSRIAIAALFLLVAAAQIKYVPYAAISAVPIILASGVSQRERTLGLPSPLVSLGVVTISGLCAVIGLFYLSPIPIVDEWRLQTLRVASDLTSVVCPSELSELIDLSSASQGSPGSHANVLTDFNDGGWFALGFVISCPHANRPRTLIDGRTLVMGERRIAEYYDLISLKDGWEHVYSSWGANAVALPETAALGKVMLRDGEQLWLKRVSSQPGWILMLHREMKSAAQLSIQNGTD